MDALSPFSRGFDIVLTGGFDFAFGAEAGLLALPFAATTAGPAAGPVFGSDVGPPDPCASGTAAILDGTGGGSAASSVGLCVGVGVWAGSDACRDVAGVGIRLLNAEVLVASTNVDGVSLRSADDGDAP